MTGKVSRVAHPNRLLIVPSGPGAVLQSIKVGDEEQVLAAGAPVELYSTVALNDTIPDDFSPVGPALDFVVVLENTTVVAITGRREDVLKEAATQIAKSGTRAIHVVMDVRNHDSVAVGMASIAKSLGSIDVLINNAGIGGPNACAADGPENWDPIVRTNLDGAFYCAREAIKHMPDGGRVINISSVLGKFGVPGYTAYCASKHGVIGFTKALALEVAARAITVNAICPGWVDTGMAREGMERIAELTGVTYEEARDGALADVPIGRILEPRESGDLVVYLASDAASGITAQSLSICGGQVMG